MCRFLGSLGFDDSRQDVGDDRSLPMDHLPMAQGFGFELGCIVADITGVDVVASAMDVHLMGKEDLWTHRFKIAASALVVAVVLVHGKIPGAQLAGTSYRVAFEERLIAGAEVAVVAVVQGSWLAATVWQFGL